jgi:hypothetical protein
MKAAVAVTSSAAIVANATVSGSAPWFAATEAASPVSHCISATPRKTAVLKTESARPATCFG